MAIPDDFLGAVVRSATPIGLAALGELVVERSGVINIGIEGAISVGAVGAAMVALAAGPLAGFAAGGAAGMAIALLFGFFVTRLRAQQIIAGAAISMLGLGVSATLHRAFLGGEAVSDRAIMLPAIPIPGLAHLPLVGGALFNQPLPTYVLYACVPMVGLLLYRTVAGVVMRATGENPESVRGGGRSPLHVQYAAIVTGGAFAGLSGATLVLAQAGVFSDGISAGRGFIAIAVVALGGWSLRGVVAGSLLFGAVSTLQYFWQAVGATLSYNVILAAPYLVTLFALAAFRGARSAPASLGRVLEGPR